MTRRKPRRRGRLLLLNADVEAKLLEATRAGVPVELAAGHAGVSGRSFSKWITYGRAEDEERSDPDYVPDPAMDQYVRLFEKITQARAQAATRSVLLIHRAAAGGAIIEESSRHYPDGTVEQTVKKSQPDWRAAAWYLDRQFRGQFGKEAAQIEMSGPGGGPIMVGHVDTEDLAARIGANMLALGSVAAGELEAGSDDDGDDGDVQDAEIVD